MRVLVVDGYDESRAAVERELGSAGYEVLAVAEEEEAVRALSSGPVEIVLLDLPIAEASEAAQAIRASLRELGARARIVAFVGPGHPRERRDEAHAAGVDYFFLRP